MPAARIPFKLLQSGIYHDVASVDYFADPCPAPSLTQSIAKVLIEKSPLHAMYEHPRLRPPVKAEDEPSEKYVVAQAIGNAAHALLIGRGKDLAVLDFDSFRSDKAKAAREEAEIVGKTPILFKHKQIAANMVMAARLQMDNHPAAPLFKQGAGEVVIACKAGDVWLRSLVDYLHDDLICIDDYKTTAMSCAPHAIPKLMVNAGWDVQASMQSSILDALDPEGSTRRRFRFIVQEQDIPYALTVCELPLSTMMLGHKKLSHALRLWSDCMQSGYWPCYPAETLLPEYPAWAESQWLNREIVEAARERIPQRHEPMLTDLYGG